MFKIMIVEDEKRIREGLATGFDWESLGFYVSDTASNGMEALTHYRENTPDIIMTDIRMPCMDGFELMETIHKENKKVKFVILSGYDIFEYAQKAIQYGVTGYLLKPVNENDLFPLMRHLHHELLIQQKRVVNDMNKSLLLKQSRQDVFDKALRKLLYGNQLESKPAEDFLSEIFMGMSQDQMSLSVISCGMMRHISAIYKCLMKYETTKHRYFLMDGDFIICILATEAPSALNQEVSLASEIFEILTKHYPDKKVLESIVISLSKPFNGVSNIHAAYMEAFDLLKYRFYTDLGKVIQTPLVQAKETLKSNEEVAFLVASAIEEGDEKALNHRIREHLACCSMTFLPKDILAFKFSDIYMMTVKKLEGMNEVHMDAKTVFENLVSILTYSNFTSQIDKLFNELHQNYRLSKAIAAQSIIKKIEMYISKNFSENISLKSLSELFHINSSYLSNLFCKKTNVPLTNYLRQVRIEKAKSLLVTSDHSISEIARMVGYHEYRHFCTTFKKEVGKNTDKLPLVHHEQ